MTSMHAKSKREAVADDIYDTITSDPRQKWLLVQVYVATLSDAEIEDRFMSAKADIISPRYKTRGDVQ